MIEGEAEQEPLPRIHLATDEEIGEAIRRNPKLEISVGANLGTLLDPKEMVEGTTYGFYDTGYLDQPLSEESSVGSPYAVDITPNIWAGELAEKGAFFSNRSGADTGLPESSVDVIKVANVLNDPNTPKKTRKGIIKEAAKILKPGGEMLISATLTPNELSVEKIIKWARKRGLLVEEDHQKVFMELDPVVGGEMGNPIVLKKVEGAYVVCLFKPYPKSKEKHRHKKNK